MSAPVCHAGQAASKTYAPLQALKNYALSSCIADGYRSREVVGDAVASANGYKALGSLDIEAYNAVATLIPEFIARHYASQSGEKLTAMKCIDFFHSKELDQLARQYARRK